MLGFSRLFARRFDSMSAVEVNIPPAIFKSVVSGKTYGIAGSVWVEVPEGTSLQQLSQYMVHKPREAVSVPGEKSWTIKGSKGNLYTVKLSEGSYSCTCPGFSFRRKCRHIEEVK